LFIPFARVRTLSMNICASGDTIKPCYGYRFEYAGRVVVLSADTRYNENVISYGTGVDLLIHEVASARPELMKEAYIRRIIAHHTSPREAGRVFAQTKPKLAAYTHIVLLGSDAIPAPTIEDVVEETRQTYDGAAGGRRGPDVF
jgi:ribonuclease Z